MKRPAFSAAIASLRILIGLFFVAAALSKFGDLAGFIESVKGYKILSVKFAAPIAYFIPSLEIVAGLALMTNQYRRGALLIIVAMLIVFSASIGSAIYRGIDVSCGCFGSSGASSNLAGALARNFALLLAAALIRFTED